MAAAAAGVKILAADTKVSKELELAILTKPFEVINNGPSHKCLALGVKRSLLYNGILDAPQTIFFHPYHPTGSTPEQAKEGTHGIPSTILSVNLGNEVLKFLPNSIQQVIGTLPKDKIKIECFFVTQTMPWKERVLLRANHWSHSGKQYDEAARTGTLNASTACRIGIFSATDANITIDNTKETLSAAAINFTSHPGMDADNKVSMTIVSPDNVGVMAGLDLNKTNSVYSLVLTSDNRLAITLHWFLDDFDQKLLGNTSLFAKNLKDIISAVQTFPKSRLTEPNGPLHHLMKLLNVNAQPNVDIKLAAELGGLKVDLKTQEELLNRFERENAAKSKEAESEKAFLAQQQALLSQFEQKKREEQSKRKEHAEILVGAFQSKKVKLHDITRDLLRFKQVYQENPKKLEHIETCLEMAHTISGPLMLLTDPSSRIDPAQLDQNKLKSMLEQEHDFEEKMRSLTEAVQSLQILTQLTQSAAAEVHKPKM